jgi:hypothetical protein
MRQTLRLSLLILSRWRFVQALENLNLAVVSQRWRLARTRRGSLCQHCHLITDKQPEIISQIS